MTLLVLALVAFGVVHVIPAIPRARAFCVGLLGRAFGPLYGVASLLLLIVCIAAFRVSEGGQLYDPPTWGRHGNFALTLVAFVFIGVFIFRGSWRNRVKYPMAVATLFWAVGHVLANGETRSVVFVVGLAGAALLHVFLASRLQEWQASAERGGHNLMSVLFGIALYGIVAQAHGAVIGVLVISLAELGN
jgi:uncharacterized membrane protein